MVSLTTSRVLATIGSLLALGCPTVQPVLPPLPQASSGSSGSTSLEPDSGSQTSTSPGSSSSGTGNLDTTTDDTAGASGSTTGGEPACGLLLEGTCGAASSPWWDPAWAHRHRIDVGSVLTESLVDVVVPVRLGDGFEHECARDDAADVRFVDDDGVVMAHEIDEWLPGAEAIAWVRIPALEPSGTSFWLYYGNPAAEAEPADVWPQELGHLAVLHFGGDLDDARGVHHGEPAVAGEPVYAPDGIVGRAVHYERILVDARAELMGSDEIDDAIIASQAFTLTAWIRSTPDVASPSQYRAVVSRGPDHWSMTVYDPAGSYDFLPPAYALFNNRCQAVECDGIVDAFDNHFLVGTEPVIEHPVTALWHHVAITYESTGGGQYAKHLYVDGELDVDFAGPLPLNWSTMALHTEPVTIGAGPLSSANAVFHGEIDEVRIASQAWDAARIQAEHAFGAQADLVAVGSAECR